MGYATEYIASTLKAARESKGLSQRELHGKAGVPQGHISKIENGAVDLRLSSLVALARILDLELMLVPRKAASAVQSIVRSSERTGGKGGENGRRAASELKRLQDSIARLTGTGLFPKELAQIRREVRELRHFRLASPEIEAIRAASHALKTLRNDPENPDALRETLSQLQSMRNALAQGSANVPQMESARPAYGLDEDDHG